MTDKSEHAPRCRHRTKDWILELILHFVFIPVAGGFAVYEGVRDWLRFFPS